LKARAWRVKHACDAAEDIMTAQASLLEQRCRLLQAQREVERLNRTAQYEGHEWGIFHAQLTDPHGAGRLLTESARQTDHLLQSRKDMKGLLGLPVPHQSEGQSPANGPALQVHLSNEQIETLAARAVIRFAQLSGQGAENAWSAWRAELNRRFPQYAAIEISQRAEELREAARGR